MPFLKKCCALVASVVAISGECPLALKLKAMVSHQPDFSNAVSFYNPGDDEYYWLERIRRLVPSDSPWTEGKEVTIKIRNGAEHTTRDFFVLKVYRNKHGFATYSEQTYSDLYSDREHAKSTWGQGVMIANAKKIEKKFGGVLLMQEILMTGHVFGGLENLKKVIEFCEKGGDANQLAQLVSRTHRNNPVVRRSPDFFRELIEGMALKGYLKGKVGVNMNDPGSLHKTRMANIKEFQEQLMAEFVY